MFLFQSLTLATLGLLLTSCAPVAVVSTASAVTSVSEERGLGGTIADAEIKTKIQWEWANSKYDLFSALDAIVRQGRVLMTGTVPTSEEQIEAIRLVWKVSGVREVINEVEVGQQESIMAYTKSSWISTQLKSKILFQENVQSLNYTIQTVKGVVYLMGIAQNKAELEKVVHLARHISGVTKVISYVVIKPQAHTIPLSTSATSAASQARGSSGQRPSAASEILKDADDEEREPPNSTTRRNSDESTQGIQVQSLEAPNTGSSFR